MRLIANERQAEQWTAEAGIWIANQRQMDAMLGTFDAPLFDAARIRKGDVVLDVGCGTGSTTFAAAGAASPGGRVVGIDLSTPMVEHARARAARAQLPATFEVGDAQVYRFAPGAYDVVISRFGVMFFDDPTAAFHNLLKATRPGGRLAFVSWQGLTAQQWMLVIGAALLPHLTEPPSMPTEGPGMFGLSDASTISSVLSDAGWSDVNVVDHQTELLVGGGGSLDETVGFFAHGMLDMMLGAIDAESRAAALASLRSALEPHRSPGGIRLRGAVWLVSASAPAT